LHKALGETRLRSSTAIAEGDGGKVSATRGRRAMQRVEAKSKGQREKGASQ